MSIHTVIVKHRHHTVTLWPDTFAIVVGETLGGRGRLVARGTYPPGGEPTITEGRIGLETWEVLKARLKEVRS